MQRIVRRVLAIIPAVLLQLFWYGILLYWLVPYAGFLSVLLSIASLVYVLCLLTSRIESSYKTLWLLIILSMPLMGAFLYFCFGNKRTAKPLRKKLQTVPPPPPFPEENNILSAVATQEPRLAQTFQYVQEVTGFLVCPVEEATYYPLGEQLFSAMLEGLEQAERFIFVEYFIIASGKMWDSMVEIMARKAKQGVDVRVMYDDFGSLTTYGLKNILELRQKGIKCIPFNPLLFIKGTLNYRDHRKMLVIDGRIAFSGGVNLADEYINAYQKYGHWKDIGFRLTGTAVLSYVWMFTEFWNAFSEPPDEKIPDTLLQSCLEKDYTTQSIENGAVLSYYDSPLRTEAISNELYIELLSQAKEYAWFFTPYLMPGDELLNAFVRAAHRGIDIRIILPGIPDKKVIYRMSRSYYTVLLEAGIKIYEYTPGFVHAKGCLIDDIIGTVGTVNLDYRSLYLHFENNSIFYKASLLADWKADFLATQAQCRERTTENVAGNFGKWFLDGILRIFAPLC